MFLGQETALPDEQGRIGAIVAGRYRIDGLLGVGAMGSVYRAMPTEGTVPVALKILRPHLLENDEASARFGIEAFVGMKIDHPNCVGVSDFGSCEDGSIFLAMEMLDGESLGDVLEREGRMPWRRALQIARHVLRGLAHAHAQDIVHRDIKPDNIFLCRGGDPDLARVLDFGIAKLVGAVRGPAITQAGLTVGTPKYLSPQQAAGGELDGRSDLYSLSAVLFEMLSGHPPFASPDPLKILLAHAHEPVPRFAEIDPALAVPPDVEALVRDGLAKLPGDRIESAAAYIARIDELLDEEAPATVDDATKQIVVDGRYQLEEMLGRGGMGHVYRAQHVALGRPVAIKVLDPDLVSDDDARRRFEREAQATGRLRHPNCVGVTDFGAMRDGRCYLVMELVEGRTLESVLDDETRLTPARAVHLMRHLLTGLAHAHAQGLVHRDLKPCNVMLVEVGGDRDFAKILDFGLARMIGAGGDRITRTGIVCGTPRYMPPEQALDRGIDARSDLYSASVMFFEMLAGRTPFDGDEAMQLLKQHLSAPVPSIAAVAPDVDAPAALEGLIRRGLSKRAEDRPATAEAYLAELDRAWAPAAPIAALAPMPARAPLRPAWLTNRRLAIGGAIAGLFAIGIIAAVATGSSPATRPAAAASRVDEPAIEMAPEARPARDPAIDSAIARAAKGGGEPAVARLRALRKKHPLDAQVPYALARVYQKLNWSGKAIFAYRDAVRLDPELREDADLINGLIKLLASATVWKTAARVLEEDVGAAALPALAYTAEHHRDATVRARAAKLRDRI